MKTDIIKKLIHSELDIPKNITTAIKSLFGIQELAELSPHRIESLKAIFGNFYVQNEKINYRDISKEYTLRYFPVNFYKIWTPLYDLLLKEQLKANCSVIEFGCGPGSSTFGFIEFYQLLAYDNPEISFNINFVLVEQEKAFFDVFKRIWDAYLCDLPDNLNINGKFIITDVSSFFASHNQAKYDFVIESNMLNANEKIEISDFCLYCEALTKMLNPHSSIILIEPGKKELTKPLHRVRISLIKSGLSVYSPCSCNNEECHMFPIARVKTGSISLVRDCSNLGIFNEKKNIHYFDYVVLRNDTLTKNEAPQNAFCLSALPDLIGKMIHFDAYILNSFNNRESFDLKICDGSGLEREVYLHIPKNIQMSKFPDLFSIGRGDYIKVKNAIVLSETKISCIQSTMIEIM